MKAANLRLCSPARPGGATAVQERARREPGGRQEGARREPRGSRAGAKRELRSLSRALATSPGQPSPACHGGRAPPPHGTAGGGGGGHVAAPRASGARRRRRRGRGRAEGPCRAAVSARRAARGPRGMGWRRRRRRREGRRLRREGRGRWRRCQASPDRLPACPEGCGGVCAEGSDSCSAAAGLRLGAPPWLGLTGGGSLERRGCGRCGERGEGCLFDPTGSTAPRSARGAGELLPGMEHSVVIGCFSVSVQAEEQQQPARR